MASRLFVGGLSWDTSDESLRAAFEAIGPVQSAEVARDRYTGKSKGFGFVEMENEADARKAIQELSGKELDGRSINVDEARPRERGSYGGGGGGGRRY
jgi:RNA recognition motif-containing protein